MRSYCSLYVDAGYLIAAASTRVTGTSLRSATDVDVPGLLTAMVEQIERDSGLPLLRIHWYDSGTRQGGPAGHQIDIATIPKVKLRLGRVGVNGEQKGVDLKLALDLITQARNQAAEVVYLVTGDDDLSEAVEEAQHLGVQVISLVVPDQQGHAISVSKNLQMTVDQMQLMEGTYVDAHVKRSATTAMREVAAVTSAPAVEQPAKPAPLQTKPSSPTPLSLAQSRPVPAPSLVRVPTSGAVAAYTTTTGEGGSLGPHARMDVEVADAISGVVDNVVVNWWRGASVASKAELEKSKPMIPAELDRTLLNDLSNRLVLSDIPQDWRYALREAFWDKLQRL